jgi:plastocyanin
MPDEKGRSRRNERRGARRSALLAVIVLPTAFAAAVAGAAGEKAGSIKGKLGSWDKLMPQVYADSAKGDGHRFNWREPSPTVKSDFRKLSASNRDLCVVAFGSAAAQAHEPFTVKVTGGRLTPSTVVLSVGSRISFKNTDPFPHTLYEVEDPKWGPNPTNSLSTREWAATTPGIHTIRDQLYPSIVMKIVVDPNAADFAVPDHDGAFSIPLPAGEYSLKVYFEGKPVGKELTGLKVGERALEIKEPLLGGEAKEAKEPKETKETKGGESK